MIPTEAAAAAGDGPALVVADGASVTRQAPAWAAAFAAAGRVHRVLVMPGGPAAAPAIVAEARSLGASAIFAAGPTPVVAAARRAAAELDRPCVELTGPARETADDVS